MDMFPYEVQMAFFIYSLLQDTWDGMNGMYMGKNLSGLATLLDIYEIEDKKLDEIATQVISNEEERKKVYNQLYDAKTLDLYKEKFKLTEKIVSYDEFVKLASEQ